ncbi:MAG TPA: acyl-CoA dehydrogenase family protein [Bacilli bacterium]|nr:acyl-CoA dehydrogenase family protein [Bacilli bacterium]
MEQTLDRTALDLLAVAREAAEEIATRASTVDEEGQFPVESLAVLRKAGLMGLIIPQEYGGIGASIHLMSQVAQILAGACLSTGMIWAMHLQQVACLIDYADESLKSRLLPRIAAGEVFVASVTSERGKGGHLLTALAPLDVDGDQVVINREAPTCTGGAQGDGYLITMRRDEDSNPSDVVLVYAEREQLDLTLQSGWQSLGMRGTQSIGLTLQGQVPCDQVLKAEEGFGQIALTSMVPVGHIAWASCWLGATQEAFRQMQRLLRDPKTRQGYPLQSDLFMEKWARIRLELDTVAAFLDKAVRDYEAMREEQAEYSAYKAHGYNIQINNLKVLASEKLYETINRLVQLAGLRFGYLKQNGTSLERTLRDLRAASLMYSNDRLLLANGKLALMDRM